jgi:hypothetical protein
MAVGATCGKEGAMSGGYFDYEQCRMQNMANRLASVIETDDEHSKETMAEFGKGLTALRVAAVYLERIDFLICGDESEETFHKRLQEDLLPLPKEAS